MQVEYLVRISLPDDGWDVNMLEEACWKAGREASKGLFLLALGKRDEEVVALSEYLYSGQDEKMLTTVKLARLLCEDEDERQKIADLVAYIDNNRDGLYGSRSLRGKVKAEKVLVCNTGAVEKNIDVVIDRRFKKHGMSWTTEGANNLLKLRTLWYNKTDWEAFWARKSSYGVSFPPTN